MGTNDQIRGKLSGSGGITGHVGGIPEITGTVTGGSAFYPISGRLSGTGGITGQAGGIPEITGTVTGGSVIYPPNYPGPYVVASALTKQVLETSGKVMDRNVTIDGIPIVRTTNIYGGKTVVIG